MHDDEDSSNEEKFKREIQELDSQMEKKERKKKVLEDIKVMGSHEKEQIEVDFLEREIAKLQNDIDQIQNRKSTLIKSCDKSSTIRKDTQSRLEEALVSEKIRFESRFEDSHKNY